MLIDCDTCVGRGRSCGECVVRLVLERGPERRVDPAAVVRGAVDGVDASMRVAFEVLLDADMVDGILVDHAESDGAGTQSLFSAESVRRAS